MNNFIIGMCIYNEEHRFLESCLKNMRELTDKIFIIDDGSTDNSYNIACKYATEVLQTNRLFEENEVLIREKLWNFCINNAENGDYIFINDADEIFTKNSTLYFEEELKKAIKLDADGLGFFRYDMWNQTQYRKDKSWNNNKISCIRIAKLRKNFNYKWLNMKHHGGSIPHNAIINCYLAKLQIQHWAYSTPELRNEKIKFYNKYDPKGEWMPQSHYNDILTENINLWDFKDFYENKNQYEKELQFELQ